MMMNSVIGGMRKNMANENKEKLVKKPGKKKTGIRKRENSNTNGYLFIESASASAVPEGASSF